MATICIVEDEPAIRDLVIEELEDCGHKVFPAVNGRDGLDVIIREKPDLIISDINMPEMNGFEMRARLLRDHSDFENTPFMFLSAFADRADIADGMVVGARAYLTKPIDFDLLIAWIDRLT
ncbi:MAG: response regulator [Pseudomonadota bacterium]